MNENHMTPAHLFAFALIGAALWVPVLGAYAWILWRVAA